MLSTLLAATLLLRGEVRNPGGDPIAAKVQSASERIDTRPDGSFVLAVHGEWPKEIRISAPGYGTEIVDPPRVHADTTLDPITLRPAATIRLHLNSRRESTLNVSLGMLPDDGDAPRWIAVRHLAPRSHDVTFADLAAGAYVVLVHGSAPMECFTQRVIVGAGSTKDVSPLIIPRRVHFQIRRRGKPLKNARLKLVNREYFWASFLTTDERGSVDTTAWTTGDFEAVVQAEEVAQPVKRFFTLAREVLIDFPARTVRGTVIDNEGAPVPGAAIVFRTASQSHELALHAKTDSAGRFAFAGVESPESTVTVFADGFLISRDSKLTGDDFRITLKRGVPTDVFVSSPDGTPLPRAEVLCMSGGHVVSRSSTAIDGRTSIATPKEASTLYVIPEDGSFATKRLERTTASKRSDLQMITVAKGTASVRINALSTRGRPISGMFVVMRHDGDTIPPDVTDEMERKQGFQLRTSERGQIHLDHVPTGSYEFWPYHSEQEAADIVDTADAASAPIKVQVLEGENTVTVRIRD